MEKMNNEILKNAIELNGKWLDYGKSNLVLLNEIKSFNEKKTIFYALVIDLDEVEISKSSKISNRVPYSIENEEIELMKIKAKDFVDVKETISDAIDRIYRKDNDLEAIITNLTFYHLIGKCFKIDNKYFLVSNITASNPDSVSCAGVGLIIGNKDYFEISNDLSLIIPIQHLNKLKEIDKDLFWKLCTEKFDKAIL